MRSPPASVDGSAEPGTPSGSTPTSPTSPPGAPAVGLGAPEVVPLPYVTVGEPVPTAVLTVTDLGGADGLPVAVAVDGPFAVDGAVDPLAVGGSRAFTVAYTGSVDDPALAVGVAEVTAGDWRVEVALAAVIGDRGLPDATWTTDDWGTRTIASFPSAPFPDGGAGPWDDGSVLVFVPAALGDHGDVGVVTHLHGFGAVLADTIADERLVELHAMSGREAVFVAPQGPVAASSGDFGQLEEAGGHARLVRDVLAVLYRDGLVTRPELGVEVVSSHSGGYAAAASVIDRGGSALSALFLYDSVYGESAAFEAFAVGGGVLFSNYTATGGTDANNVALRSDLEDDGLIVVDDFRLDRLLAADAAVGFTASDHAHVMRDGATHARWLAASPLRRSPSAAPELLAVVSDGARAEVRWRADRADAGLVTVIEGSDDGVGWDELGRSATDRGTVDARPYVRVRGVEDRQPAVPGDVYAGGGGDWLVVDGFHRLFDGSWPGPTHDFAGRLGVALGGASTAVDDAVAEGVVSLDDWDHVLWLLGDESTADVTFDRDVQDALTAYVDRGGRLIVTGSELGYATDPALLAVLGVDYVADDAGTDTAGGHRFGVVYPEDFPDVLAGDETVWTYATGGGAAVGRDHRVLAVGFALETMADDALVPAVAELVDWLR